MATTPPTFPTASGCMFCEQPIGELQPFLPLPVYVGPNRLAVPAHLICLLRVVAGEPVGRKAKKGEAADLWEERFPEILSNVIRELLEREREDG